MLFKDSGPPPTALERCGFDQFSRNRLVARVLVERSYIEEVGLGIRRMRKEMEHLALPESEFGEDGFSFVITFRSIAPARVSDQRWIRSVHCGNVARSTSGSTALRLRWSRTRGSSASRSRACAGTRRGTSRVCRATRPLALPRLARDRRVGPEMR